jgi:hypothetical protein
MKSTTVRLMVLLLCLTAAAATAQTERTETLTGTVVQVDGGVLIVEMANGEIRSFTPPAERRFVIDGRELQLSELKPGTKLNATVKQTSTTTTARTVETLEGTVWFASGPAVVLRLPTGENRQYHIKSTDPVKFYDSAGKEIGVFDLRKNMRIKATKITESPQTELVSNIAVTGTAPVQAAAAQAPAPAPAPRQATQPSPAAAPAPAAEPAAAAPPKTLPPTASSLPLLGLTGMVSLVIGLGLTLRRRATR